MFLFLPKFLGKGLSGGRKMLYLFSLQKFKTFANCTNLQKGEIILYNKIATFKKYFIAPKTPITTKT